MRKEIAALTKTPKDPAAQSALRRMIGDHACLMVVNGKIDAAATERCYEFLQDLGALRATSGKYAAAVTLDEWLATGKKRLRADPSVGLIDGRFAVALDPDGVSQDEAGVLWADVPEERMPLVLLGRQSGLIEQHPGPSVRWQWARELSAASLAAPWTTLLTRWQALPQAARLAIEEELVYTPPAAQKPTVARVEPPFPPDIQIGGSVSGSVIISGSGNRVETSAPPAPGACRVFVVVDEADAALWKELRKHLANLIRQGLVLVTSSSNCPPGNSVARWTHDAIAKSDLILVMVSSNSINNGDDIDLAMNVARINGIRLAPILARPVALAGHPLNGLVALPGGTVTTTSGNRPRTLIDDRHGEVYAEIAQAIRAFATKK